MTLSPPVAGARSHLRRAFTLVEVMMATAVGAIVLAAVASIIVMSVRMVYKNQEIDASATNTRLIQEHVNGEMSIAISQTSPVSIRPTYSLPSTTTPTRYARVAYKVQIGSFATVSTSTAKTATALTIGCPSDIVPKVNDYLLMDTPNLGAGIRITAVSGSGGTYSLTLETSILAGTIDNDPTEANVAASSLVRIQRQRAYQTVDPTDAGLPATSPVTQLRWYETWYEPTAADTPYVILSKNVDSSSRYMFAQIPEEPATPDPSIEPAVSWQFSYVSVGNGAVLPGSTSTYYQTNYAEGMIMPKSGNPLNTSSILGGGSTTTTTTSTTTSSTTTSSTTTSISTTSTTTSVSTTSTTTSVTTTSTTTSVSTSSTTTTSTSYTTTSTTTSISTSSVSSTSVSTSSTSSTSTSVSTTSSTTSVSTSSVSTSSSTTTSTSATTSSTTTSVATTSTTSSTTSSISTSTSTSSVTTTSIPFDG